MSSPGGRERVSSVSRKTKETDIRVELSLDGTGQYEVATGIPFFSHMLESFTRHSLFDLRLAAEGGCFRRTLRTKPMKQLTHMTSKGE